MVSEDFSIKISPPPVLQQCLVSSMNPRSVHSEHLGYGLQFQNYCASPCHNTHGEQINRPEVTTMSSLICGNVGRENSQLGIGCGNGHEPSLTLGTSNSHDRSFSGMTSALLTLQRSPYLKPAQQLLDEVVCVSNAVESGPYGLLRKHVEIGIADGRLHRMGENMDGPEENDYLSVERNAVHVRISKLVALLDQVS